jgi:hypothetical protein
LAFIGGGVAYGPALEAQLPESLGGKKTNPQISATSTEAPKTVTTSPSSKPSTSPKPSSGGSSGNTQQVLGAYGFSAGELVDLNQSTLDSRLSDFKNVGVKWVRMDIPWSQVQAGGPNSYNWDSYDRVVQSVQKHGLNMLAIVDYTPAWARASGCNLSEQERCRPADPNRFAQYAGAVAARYAGNGVNHFEVWNEQNHGSFWPTPNAASYAQLLTPTYKEIKAKNPNATVIAGGMAPALTGNGDEIGPADFVKGLYAAGAGNSFDALAMHPYSYPALPSFQEDWVGWQQMIAVRAVMAGKGDGNKKIWMTEFGAPTGGTGAGASQGNYNFSNNPDHVDHGLQAAIYADAIRLHKSYDWAGPLFFYGYRDMNWDASNESFFGVYGKPAYDTIKGAIGGQ